MEGRGWAAGSARHSKMVQEIVDGVSTLIKSQKEIEPEVGIEVHELLKAKLDQAHVEVLMGLVSTKVFLDKGGKAPSKADEQLPRRLHAPTVSERFR